MSSYVDFVLTVSRHIDISELDITCQRWDIRGENPKLLKTQILKTPKESIWSLYDYPVAQRTAGRPTPVAVTPDLETLRIGSQIFSKDGRGHYRVTARRSIEETYIDEFASCGSYIAITSRRNMSYEDLYQPENKIPSHITDDSGQSLARKMHMWDYLGEVEKLESASTVSRTASGDTNDTLFGFDAESSRTSTLNDVDSDNNLPPKFESIINLACGPSLPEKSASPQQIDEDEEYFKTDTESDGNSADEEWSEGSSEEEDGLEVEDQWDDWGNGSLTLEDLKADILERSVSVANSFCDYGSDKNQDGEADGDYADSESQFSLEDELEIEIDQEIDSDDAPSVESNYSLSNYDEYSDSDAAKSDTAGPARHLDTLIFGQRDRSKAARKTTIHVYNLSTQETADPPVFHFSRFISNGIFNSPPVFHPSKSLLVWPLGDGEILFADYEINTYFTRFLCCSRYKSQHVFVKTHISASGDHLHFAALEAGERDEKLGGGISLTLQVSTHRFSVHKTTRSPPRLIHKTTISLGHHDSLNVSNLPYTFHWTEMELFVTTKGLELDVVRIPLFRDPEDDEQKALYIKNRIFLPRTAAERNVYFFPPSRSSSVPASMEDSTVLPQRVATTPNPSHFFSKAVPPPPQSKKPKLKIDRSSHATVIIGSHSSIPSQGLIVPKYQASPPIGVFLHEQQDLGGWTSVSKRISEEEEEGEVRLRGGGGRLRGRFESFDRNEDCDIVPFLY